MIDLIGRLTIYPYTCIDNLLLLKSPSTGGGGIETTSILSFKVPIIKQGVRLLMFTLSLLGFLTGHLGRGYA